MYRSQINCILETDSYSKLIFAGTFACNKVSNAVISRNKFIIIVNTAPSTHPGVHWVLFTKLDSENVFFFDSLAKPIDLYGIFFKNLVVKLSKSFKIMRNLHILQTDTSTLCGTYCIYIALGLSRGIPINTLLKKFSVDNLNLNDKKIHRWFQKFLSKTRPSILNCKVGQTCTCYQNGGS